MSQDRKYTILIVEDSESDRVMYRRYLLANENCDYQILEAGTLEEGLERWKAESPDLVLADINLPDGSGLELLATINKTYPSSKIPVIMMTCQGNERLAVQAMKLGASDYLVKDDITASTLCHDIENAIEHQRLDSAVDVAPVGIFRSDELGNGLYVNQRWCQITGLSFEQALDTGWSQGLHPDDREAISREWYESAQENRPFRMEYRFVTPKGDIVWVLGESSAERNSVGEITGYIGTLTDIGDRKQAEQENLRITERFQFLMASSPAIIYSCKPDGNYGATFMSENVKAILGGVA